MLMLGWETINVWRIFDKICDFFTNLADWVIGGGVMLLLGIGALAGIGAIYRASGVSDEASVILGILTFAILAFVIYRLSKAHSEKKKRESDARVAAWLASDSDGMTSRERFEQQNYLNAARKVEDIKRDLSSLETRRTQMSEQEYQNKKRELEGQLGVWQDATNLSYKLWQDEAHK